LVIGALAAIISPVDPLTAFFALLALSASALLAPFVLGLMWSRMTAGGALAGVGMGGVVCLTLAFMGWSATGGLVILSLAASAGASVLVSLTCDERSPAMPVRVPRDT